MELSSFIPDAFSAFAPMGGALGHISKPVASDGVAPMQAQQVQGASKFGKDIEEEANGYFQRIYSTPESSSYLSVEDVSGVQLMYTVP